MIREFCTFNRGTAQGAGVTRLGNDNFMMAYVHLAHDCQVGNFMTFTITLLWRAMSRWAITRDLADSPRFISSFVWAPTALPV